VGIWRLLADTENELSMARNKDAPAEAESLISSRRARNEYRRQVAIRAEACRGPHMMSQKYHAACELIKRKHRLLRG